MPTCVPDGCCAWLAVGDSDANTTAAAIAPMRCLNMVIAPCISVAPSDGVTSLLHPVARSRPTREASHTHKNRSIDQQDRNAGRKVRAYRLDPNSPIFRRASENSEITVMVQLRLCCKRCQTQA